MNGPPDFREVQHFRQWWVWVLVIGLTALVWWFFLFQIVGGVDVGDEPAPDWLLWGLVIVFGIAFPLWFALLRLVTEVGGAGIDAWFRWGPGRVHVDYHEIAEHRAVVYRPIREFGGWGVRWGGRGKRALNAYGTDGVRITRLDGTELVIGSQRAAELEAAITARRGVAPPPR